MLTYLIVGSRKIEDILRELPQALDTEKILDEGAALMFNRQRTRFLQQVDPHGIPWTPSFAAKKERRATLFKTGKLFRSIQLYAAGPNERAIGTDVTNDAGFPYGMALQYDKIVPRVFLGFNESEDVPTMVDLVFHRIEEAIT
jgi:hypothetical protein